jgi:hypothetical protein
MIPWNHSFTGLENFIINNRFCKEDLTEIENKAQILTQFCDYVFQENANRWRDSDPFLSTGELKNTWNAFFSARPQSAFSRKDAMKQGNQAQKKFSRPNVGLKKLPFIDVCYIWNKGTCNIQSRHLLLFQRHPVTPHVRSPHRPSQSCNALWPKPQETGGAPLKSQPSLNIS